MQDFLETPRFDTHISLGSSGGPGFKSSVFTGESGLEGLVRNWDVARARYIIDQSIRDDTDIETIRNLFMAVRGKAVGFRFKDWGDYTLTDELCGYGDGSNRVFKLYKTYGGGTPQEYVRRIFKPVSATITVKVNDVTANPSTYTVSYTAGTITFNLIDTPVADAAITASGQFDVPVRFDTDDFDAVVESFRTQSWTGIPLIELRLEE